MLFFLQYVIVSNSVICIFLVRHGSSQPDLEPSTSNWSLLTVIILAAVLTLIIFVFVATIIAKLGSNGSNSTNIRANNDHQNNGLNLHLNSDDVKSNNSTLINKAFQDHGHDSRMVVKNNNGRLMREKSPDIIPHFNGKYRYNKSELS